MDGIIDFKNLVKSIIGLQESVSLEFKRSVSLSKANDKRNELVKDISAMANSAGGRIVYGIREENGYAVAIDDGVDPSFISADWICQTIESNTSPRIRNITIKCLKLDDLREIYIVDIAQSTTLAPHQNAIDKKYYKRSNSIVLPMEDYEIRDILNRSKFPEVEISISFDNKRKIIENFENRNFKIRVTAENLSLEPSLYNVIEIHVDARLQIVTPGGFSDRGTRQIDNYNYHNLQSIIKVPETLPLLKGSSVDVNPDLELSIPKNKIEEETYVIGYSLLTVGQRKQSFGTLGLTRGNLIISEMTVEKFS